VEAFKSLNKIAKTVSCGWQTTFILTTDGEVYSCGGGERGLLGTGNLMKALIPEKLKKIEDEEFIDVSAGYNHTLLLTASGGVYSFGYNNNGQLGCAEATVDMFACENTPVLINRSYFNDEKVVQVSAGNSRSAAVTASGALYIWGGGIGVKPKLFDVDGQKITKVECAGDYTTGSATIALTDKHKLYIHGSLKSSLLGRKIRLNESSIFVQEFTLLKALESLKVVDFQSGFGQHMYAFVESLET
jgi:alpha-tubulin suppressor-like RCC1 family protein